MPCSYGKRQRLLSVVMESKKKKTEISKIVALAEDEKKMDGAPETELADVTVFLYDELEVSFCI
jgi:hypothetical protein